MRYDLKIPRLGGKTRKLCFPTFTFNEQGLMLTDHYVLYCPVSSMDPKAVVVTPLVENIAKKNCGSFDHPDMQSLNNCRFFIFVRD